MFVISQLEEFEEAARCCFTFLHFNPSDELALSSVGFYRNTLGLKDGEFVYREPDIISYQESYIKGWYRHWVASINDSRFGFVGVQNYEKLSATVQTFWKVL